MANGTVPFLNGLSAGKKIGTLLRHVVGSVLELRADHASLRTILTTDRTFMLNRVLTAPGLTIGTSSATAVKIGNTFKFLHGGVPKSKASAEKAFTATTHDITPDAGAAQERWYLYSIAADETVTCTAGVQGAVGSGTIPATPANTVAFGLLRLELAAGATPFDATTDELSAAHLTDEYTDLIAAPNPTDVGTVFAALSSTAPNSI